jgi:hypothetical protein
VKTRICPVCGKQVRPREVAPHFRDEHREFSIGENAKGKMICTRCGSNVSSFEKLLKFRHDICLPGEGGRSRRLHRIVPAPRTSEQVWRDSEHRKAQFDENGHPIIKVSTSDATLKITDDFFAGLAKMAAECGTTKKELAEAKAFVKLLEEEIEHLKIYKSKCAEYAKLVVEMQNQFARPQ